MKKSGKQGGIYNKNYNIESLPVHRYTYKYPDSSRKKGKDAETPLTPSDDEESDSECGGINPYVLAEM
jgi:hypothetical protein